MLNFLIKIVEDILKYSCFANAANMLQWQLKKPPGNSEGSKNENVKPLILIYLT